MLREKIMEVTNVAKDITIEGKGNFVSLYHKIPILLASLFDMDKEEFVEKKYADKGDSVEVLWDAVKKLDKYSFYEINVSLSGKKDGSQVKVTYSIVLKTEIWRDTIWSKTYIQEFIQSLWYDLIYSKKRKKYVEDGKVLSKKFYEELKNFIGE